mmetsp:Transcript_30407/g.26824  ORF Transcript_30407/g.26824 Transcript_30407/m.26824 type:complete len:375 (+) Transcript_30407:87-1211(+)
MATNLSNYIKSNNHNKLDQALNDDYKDFPCPPSNINQQKPSQKTIISKQQKYDKFGNETIDFPTDYGTQRVTIEGDISSGKPIIMTYHDIGINHRACFTSFFTLIREYDPKFKYFTLVHIDAPQHHYDDIENEHGPSTIYNDDKVESFDLLELASQIEEIRSKLGIERFLAFGVGAASNIFTHYAMNYSDRLRGMVLVNGLGSIASWREWIFDQLLWGIGSKSQFLVDSFQGSLLTRYFPKVQSQETYDYCLDQFDKIDAPSSIKYFRGFVRRTEFTEKQLARITCKTLIICGEYSRVKNETIAFQKMMPRQYTTFVLMSETGFLLTESCPQKLCSSIDLFVQSLGLTKISLENKFGKLVEQNQLENGDGTVGL